MAASTVAVVDLDAEEARGEVGDPVALGARVEEIGRHRGVHHQSPEVDAERKESPHDLLRVVRDHSEVAPDPCRENRRHRRFRRERPASLRVSAQVEDGPTLRSVGRLGGEGQ